MFCIPDLFSISKAIVSLSCLITKYSVVWWYRWHRCVVGSNLMRHHNGEFSYWGHWISVAWSHISLNLLNKEKLILCSIFLTFVIKALYCSCRWLAFEECLVNAYNRKALFLQWEIRLINGRKEAVFPLTPRAGWADSVGSFGRCLAEVLGAAVGTPGLQADGPVPLLSAKPLSRGGG